jgi:dynactin 1
VSDSPSSVTGTPPVGLSAGAELEYWRNETRDLGEKLETLRMKRAEDKQKLLDYEKCRVQLQQLIEYKARMQEAHTAMQRQLQEAQKVCMRTCSQSCWCTGGTGGDNSA